MIAERHEIADLGAIDFSEKGVERTGAEILNKWHAVSGDGLLTSRVPEGSLLIAVHDPNEDNPTGYLGQFSLQSFKRTRIGTDSMEDMFDKVQKGMEESSNPDSFSVWATGASLSKHFVFGSYADSENMINERLIRSRGNTLMRLADMGLQTITANWLHPNEVIVDLSFQTGTGKIDYVVGPSDNPIDG